MKCLLLTVFTLVLICALFKGTESAERREMPSIRYFAKFEGGGDPRRVENALLLPWGMWYLDFTHDVPRFSKQRPEVDGEWTPIAQLKLIGDKMHVIQMYGTIPENSPGRDPYNFLGRITRPGYRWRRGYHRLPSSGSGLLLVPESILDQPTEAGAGVFYDEDPNKLDPREIIDLITVPFKEFGKCTISIQGHSRTILEDYRGEIPVYTTIFIRNSASAWIYQAVAGQLISMMMHYPDGLNEMMSRIGDIEIIHPSTDLIYDDASRMQVWVHGRDWIELWISKSQTPLILSRMFPKSRVVFVALNDPPEFPGG